MNSSSSSFRIALACLVFLLAGLLGWALRYRPMTDVDSTSSADQHAIRRPTTTFQDAQRQLSEISASASADERIYATFNLVNSIPVADFARWSDEGWFNSREGFELTLFQRLMEERWQREDPENFVLWCLREGSGNSKISSGTSSDSALPILRDWAVNDPERLQRVLQKNPSQMLEGQLIGGLVDKHPQVALDLLKALGNNSAQSDSYRYHQSISSLAETHFDLLEKSLDDLSPDLRRDAERELLNSRLRKDFDTEIDRLLGDPESPSQLSAVGSSSAENLAKLAGKIDQFPARWLDELKSGGFNSQLSREGGEAWLNADLVGAGLSTEQASKVRSWAAYGLTRRDPEGVFEQFHQLDLTENDRKFVLINSLRSLNQSNPEQADTLVNKLHDQADREQAKQYLDDYRKPKPDSE